MNQPDDVWEKLICLSEESKYLEHWKISPHWDEFEEAFKSFARIFFDQLQVFFDFLNRDHFNDV